MTGQNCNMRTQASTTSFLATWSCLSLYLIDFQAVHRFWDHNDVKGAIGAMEKMADHSVSLLVLCFLFSPDMLLCNVFMR